MKHLDAQILIWDSQKKLDFHELDLTFNVTRIIHSSMKRPCLHSYLLNQWPNFDQIGTDRGGSRISGKGVHIYKCINVGGSLC